MSRAELPCVCLSTLLLASACASSSSQPPPGSTSTVAVSSVKEEAPLPPTENKGTPYVWKNVAILGGGFVTGIVFSPAKAGLVYARTDVGGAYRQNPDDGSWIPLTDEFGRADSNYLGIESIAPDPTDAQKVYAAVGTYTQSWAGRGAILRSSDQGTTWQITPMPLKMGGNEDGRSNGERLAVDPNEPKVLYFGSRRDGLWKSADAGASFAKVASFPQQEDAKGLGIPFVIFDKKSGAAGKPTPVIYAGLSKTDTNLFQSSDAGASWKPVAGQPGKLMPSHAAFDSSGAIYLSYGNVPGPSDVVEGAVWRFEPKSKAWTNVTPLAPSADDKFGYGGLGVDASKPGVVMVTTIDRWTKGDEIFRTADGGKHWTPLMAKAEWNLNGAEYVRHEKPKFERPHWTGDIDIDPFDSKRAMFVTGAGLFASKDVTGADSGGGTHWSFDNRGLEETVVGDLLSPPTGAHLFSGVGDICGFRHDDLAAPAAKGAYHPPCNGTRSLDFAELKPEMMVRSGTLWGNGTHGAFSVDGGTTWTGFAKEPPGAADGGMISISADGSNVVWSVKENPVVYSSDRGASWNKVKGLPDAAKLPGWVQVNLRPAADRVNPSKSYLLDVAKGQVYASNDGGHSYEATQSGLESLPDWAMSSGSIQAVPGSEGDVWITTSKDLFRSTDSGKTFRALGTVEESHGLGFGKARGGQTYPSLYLIGKVKGTAGFFRSDDIGKTWVRINDDKHQYGFTNVITGDPRLFGRVYVGTGGRGILYGEPTP